MDLASQNLTHTQNGRRFVFPRCLVIPEDHAAGGRGLGPRQVPVPVLPVRPGDAGGPSAPRHASFGAL